MRRQVIVVVVALVVIFGGIFGGKLYASHRAAVAASHRAFPPTAVSTATAREAPWSNQVQVVGSLAAVAGTEITAQIAGNVTRVAFHSGTRVRKGELLVQLDDSSQLAQLHADQARLQLARSAQGRAQKLFAAHATSKSDLQTANANLGTAEAAVASDKATLHKLAITAPFAGVVGIREVSLGQYVSPGTTVVNLQNDDPLYLDFSLPQSEVGKLATGQDVAFSVDAYPGQSFTGKVTALGSRVDPATRNINLQATLANPDGKLRPGMYGQVTLTVGKAAKGVVLPDTAITFNTFGDNVYIVRKDAKGRLTAHEHVVTVSARRDGKALIGTGVRAGDVVVTAGQNKLRDGAPVAVNNRVQP